MSRKRKKKKAEEAINETTAVAEDVAESETNADANESDEDYMFEIEEDSDAESNDDTFEGREYMRRYFEDDDNGLTDESEDDIVDDDSDGLNLDANGYITDDEDIEEDIEIEEDTDEGYYDDSEGYADDDIEEDKSDDDWISKTILDFECDNMWYFAQFLEKRYGYQFDNSEMIDTLNTIKKDCESLSYEEIADLFTKMRVKMFEPYKDLEPING